MGMYLKDEDYAEAKKNGLRYGTAYNRFYNLGWSREDAITLPLRTIHPGRKGGIWKDYKDKAEAIGISRGCFEYRVKQGMSPERAISFPPSKNTDELIKKEVQGHGRTKRNRLQGC